MTSPDLRADLLDDLRADGEHLVYLPVGAHTAPLVLTGDDDLAEYLTSERERTLLPALLDLASRRVSAALATNLKECPRDQ